MCFGTAAFDTDRGKGGGGGKGGFFHSKVIGMLVVFLGYKILILLFFRVFFSRGLKSKSGYF